MNLLAKTKKNFQTGMKIIEPTARRLVLHRKLGHRFSVPGAGQWRILTDETDEQCWICDRQILTIFVWNEQAAI